MTKIARPLVLLAGCWGLQAKECLAAAQAVAQQKGAGQYLSCLVGSSDKVYFNYIGR